MLPRRAGMLELMMAKLNFCIHSGLRIAGGQEEKTMPIEK
jgi:hypothetical protein